jgi:hypothetical protein
MVDKTASPELIIFGQAAAVAVLGEMQAALEVLVAVALE